jgi:hypothetical protein
MSTLNSELHRSDENSLQKYIELSESLAPYAENQRVDSWPPFYLGTAKERLLNYLEVEKNSQHPPQIGNRIVTFAMCFSDEDISDRGMPLRVVALAKGDIIEPLIKKDGMHYFVDKHGCVRNKPQDKEWYRSQLTTGHTLFFVFNSHSYLLRLNETTMQIETVN